MEKTQTAEDLILNFEIGNTRRVDIEDAEYAMIEFARLHVEAALKAASEQAHTKDIPYTDDVEVDKVSIIKSYPLENIK